MKKVHDVAWNETQAHEHNDGDMEPPKGKSHKLPIGTRGEEELEEVYDYRYKDKYGRMLIAYQIKEQELWLLVLAQILAVSPLSVVPLKIGKNNCKPGETYRKTPSICKIQTLYRANFAEDRHQHFRGGLSKTLLAVKPILNLTNRWP